VHLYVKKQTRKFIENLSGFLFETVFDIEIFDVMSLMRNIVETHGSASVCKKANPKAF